MVGVYLPHAGRQAINEFSEKAAEFGIAKVRAGSEARAGRRCLVVTLAVGDKVDEETIEWISKSRATVRWGAFEFRVLVSADDRRIYYRTKTPIWGAVYYSGFAKFVEETLRP